jgi:transcriptional regulator with XRE-family HTH domain
VQDLRVAWPELAEQLRLLRETAGLTTRALATRLEEATGTTFSQSKVTKLENGHTPPSVDDVRVWLQVTGVSAERTAHLLDLAARAQTEAVEMRAERMAGRPLPELQQVTAATERTAMLLRAYTPTIIPALLQTPDYARQVFTSIDPDRLGVAEGIAERMRRQQILWQPRRRFEFVVGETALRWRFGPAAVQLAQLTQVSTLSELGNVVLALLPLGRQTPVWHTQGFTLFEERTNGDPFVHVETPGATVNLAAPEAVRMYQEILDRLRDLAVVGDEARAMIEQVMSDTEGNHG